MKIIDLKDEFIVTDHVVTVRLENSKAFSIYAANGIRHTFVFDSQEHANDCFRNLKSFLRSIDSLEDFFSINNQPGYIERTEYTYLGGYMN